MKRIIAIMLLVVMALGLCACGSSGSSSSTKKEDKEYVKESDYDKVFTNPDDYKGKYIKLYGQLLDDSEKDGDTVAFQAYYDIENCDKDFVVNTTLTDQSFKSNDYVYVDGKITGTFTGENYFGSEITCPLIEEAKVKESNYVDAAVPTIKEIKPDVTEKQNKFKITVEKIEFAEKETRVYLSMKNDSSDTVGTGIYDIRVIQDGKQYSVNNDSMTMENDNLKELDYEVESGASTDGVVVLEAIDPDKDFQLIVPDIYSDNYDIEFKDMKLDISVGEE